MPRDDHSGAGVNAWFSEAVGRTAVFVNPLIKAGVLIVEAMFIVGGIGSVVVLVWVGFEDFRTMFKPGEEEE
jgi:hypothetical protein